MNEIDKQKLKIKMEIMNNVSKELYNKCLTDPGCENLVDPVNWIYNQDKMRTMWEMYKPTYKDQSNLFKMCIANNNFSKYMDFMYDTYPIGFGNKLKECYNKNIPFDGAQEFYSLSNKKVYTIKLN
jgi:hypothetical protein